MINEENFIADVRRLRAAYQCVMEAIRRGDPAIEVRIKDAGEAWKRMHDNLDSMGQDAIIHALMTGDLV